MKKFIKAIPLLSSALVVSAPIITLTSCSDRYEKFTYVFDQLYPAKDFIPHDKSTLKEATSKQAADDLFNAFAKHKNILADNIIYQMTHTAGGGLIPPQGNFTGQIDVYIGQVNTKTHSISFKLHVNIVGINDGLNYEYTVECTNWKQYVFFNDEQNKWMCLHQGVYFNLLGIDGNWIAILKAYLRYHWTVSFDMNPTVSQKFIKKVVSYDIPYIGPLHFDIDTNNFSLYEYVDTCCAIEIFILGQQDPQAYYLSDVKYIEE